MVLLAQRREMAEGAGCPVSLDSGLDDRTEGKAAFDRVGEDRSTRREAADILFDEQIDGVDRRPDFLAQDWSERGLVRRPFGQHLAVFPEETRVEPILAALRELEQIL